MKGFIEIKTTDGLKVVNTSQITHLFEDGDNTKMVLSCKTVLTIPLNLERCISSYSLE